MATFTMLILYRDMSCRTWTWIGMIEEDEDDRIGWEDVRMKGRVGRGLAVIVHDYTVGIGDFDEC